MADGWMRLTEFDAARGPPGSRSNRQDLGFGRYDYAIVPEKDTDGKSQKSAAEVQDIVERLRKEIPRPPEQTFPSKHRKVSTAEADTIFSRLQQCDYKKGPVGSNKNRRDLGMNRYDYFDGPESKENTRRVSKEKLAGIVDRLSTYDITKAPPGSRGHEKKQGT